MLIILYFGYLFVLEQASLEGHRYTKWHTANR